MLKGMFIIVACIFMIANVTKIVLDVLAVRKTKAMFEKINRKDN